MVCFYLYLENYISVSYTHLLNISVSTLPFISIIISQKMLNMLQIGGEKSTLIKVLILYTTIKMVSLILNNFNSYYLTKYSDYLFYHLNVLFLDKCSRLDYQDFENPQIYDALQRAEQQIGIRPVSYTHLDVYKRQIRYYVKDYENSLFDLK